MNSSHKSAALASAYGLAGHPDEVLVVPDETVTASHGHSAIVPEAVPLHPEDRFAGLYGDRLSRGSVQKKQLEMQDASPRWRL